MCIAEFHIGRISGWWKQTVLCGLPFPCLQYIRNVYQRHIAPHPVATSHSWPGKRSIPIRVATHFPRAHKIQYEKPVQPPNANSFGSVLCARIDMNATYRNNVVKTENTVFCITAFVLGRKPIKSKRNECQPAERQGNEHRYEEKSLVMNFSSSRDFVWYKRALNGIVIRNYMVGVWFEFSCAMPLLVDHIR